MGYGTGYSTGYGSGLDGGITVTVGPSGIVAVTLARGITTGLTVYPTVYATAYGGFFSFTGPVVLPTTLATVLRQIAATIGGAGISNGDQVITPTRSFVSLEAEPYPAAGGPQGIVSPGAFTARSSHQDGMGRNLATKDGSFRVHVADVCAKDVANQDTLRLLEAEAGLLDIAHQIIALLDTEFVVDAGGNLLTIEPVFHREQGAPQRYAADNTWAGVDLEFSLSYVAQMSSG